MDDKRNERLFQLMESLQYKIDNLHHSPAEMRQWIPKAAVKKFLGLGETQMTEIAKRYNILSTTVHKQKYYKTQSLLQLFARNIKKYR